MTKTLLAVGLAFGCSACSTTNLADVLKAAGQDPASICGSVQSVYGTMKFSRTNITNGNIKCDGDGLTVTSGTPSVPVGVHLVPVVPVQ